MGAREELDGERPEIDAGGRWHHRHRYLRRIALGSALGLEQRRAELGRVDLALQLRPEVYDSAEMILMGMRQHEAHQILALLLQEADVGHDQVDPRQMFLVAKGNAEIDREP